MHESGFDAGCSGDRREAEARRSGKGGKSWNAIDAKAASEGESILWIARIWWVSKCDAVASPES